MTSDYWTKKMQRNQEANVVENGVADKSLAEWPTLGDVCSNVKQPSLAGGVARSSKMDQRRTNSPQNKHEGDDSAKENEDSPSQVNPRGGKKKPKWVPFEIQAPPYRKRFERNRSSFEQNRSYTNGNCEKKNVNVENSNGNENSTKNSRSSSSRYRGKRGRGFSNNSRQRQEESPRRENDTANDNPDQVTDADYFQTMYYDPYTHSHYASITRRNELKKAIRTQIEYYFSEDNLMKDIYMRRKMDSNGYIPLTLVANFPRVQNLTNDFQTIVEALDESDKLEILDNTKVRPVVDPLKWPIQDYPGLRPDVPDFIPGQPYFTLTTVIEDFQNMHFYCGDEFDANQQFADGVVDSAENSFENMAQMAQVEATS